jgi:hypothetical protein
VITERPPIFGRPWFGAAVLDFSMNDERVVFEPDIYGPKQSAHW